MADDTVYFCSHCQKWIGAAGHEDRTCKGIARRGEAVLMQQDISKPWWRRLWSR